MKMKKITHTSHLIAGLCLAVKVELGRKARREKEGENQRTFLKK